jgi:hypothetical protein
VDSVLWEAVYAMMLNEFLKNVAKSMSWRREWRFSRRGPHKSKK